MNFKSDIYGLGCLLYEMTFGKTPYFSKDYSELKQKTLKNNIPNLNSEKYSKSFNDLIHRMLQKDPVKRIYLDEIITHPWFKGLEAF